MYLFIIPCQPHTRLGRTSDLTCRELHTLTPLLATLLQFGTQLQTVMDVFDSVVTLIVY
jgi:hypothetical protein